MFLSFKQRKNLGNNKRIRESGNMTKQFAHSSIEDEDNIMYCFYVAREGKKTTTEIALIKNVGKMFMTNTGKKKKTK